MILDCLPLHCVGRQVIAILHENIKHHILQRCNLVDTQTKLNANALHSSLDEPDKQFYF